MTMTENTLAVSLKSGRFLSEWLSEGARNYVAHTVQGLSIRALARQQRCHPSTVLRQIRRIEMRRDDPLVDEALQMLSDCLDSKNSVLGHLVDNIEAEMPVALSALAGGGSILAVGENMDKAVVVDPDGAQATTHCVISRTTAKVLALRGWVTRVKQGKISRYKISTSGRTALSRMPVRQVRASHYKGDVALASGGDPRRSGVEQEGDGASFYGQIETPVAMLARRRDKTGKAFLAPELVNAAERLRQDYTVSLMEDVGRSADHVREAFEDLGPGLSDVVLRCCCQLEGLETAERDLGWSARSGKVVLRIALQRLHRHYQERGVAAALIG